MKITKIFLSLLLTVVSSKALAGVVTFEDLQEGKEVTVVDIQGIGSYYRLVVHYQEDRYNQNSFIVEMKSYESASSLAQDLLGKNNNARFTLEEKRKYEIQKGKLEDIYIRGK